MDVLKRSFRITDSNNNADKTVDDEYDILDGIEEDQGSQSLFGTRVSCVLSKLNLDNCDAALVVNMLKNPSIKVLQSFNSKLRTANVEWLENFLHLKGFEVLFEDIEILSESVRQLSDAMLLLECVTCVKNIMNSRVGLEYFLQHLDSGRKLVKAIDSKNVLVKKQVFELFSAVTAFSAAGYQMTLDSLENYKVKEQKRYRFGVIVDEIQPSNDQVDYWTTILGFINCLIIANKGLYERVNVRNEFIGLRLLELLDQIGTSNDEKLLIQCNVFYEEMHLDDTEMSNLKPGSIDISSHRQLFDIIMQQTTDEATSSQFLNVLQCLMHVSYHPNSKRIWSGIQTCLSKYMTDDKSCQKYVTLSGKDNLCDTGPKEKHETISTIGKVPKIGPEQYAESLPEFSSKEIRMKKTNVTESKVNLPVELRLLSDQHMDYQPDSSGDTDSTANIPKPKSIMKPLQWNKISKDSIKKKSVVWSDVLEMKHPLTLKLDEVEQLFAHEEGHGNISPAYILSLRRKAAINNLLTQFRMSIDKIIKYVKDGQEQKLGGRHNIQSLSEMLPYGDELECLTIYQGDFRCLSSAEKFLKRLIEIPEYALRIEVMLLKCDFEEIYNNAAEVLPQISLSCHAVMENKSLKEFLRLVLLAGNFINTGLKSGNAVGFKISSLSKLMEMRSNKTSMSLLHYLVQEAEKIDGGRAVKFVQELMPYLSKTSGFRYKSTSDNASKLQSSFQTVKEHLLHCSSDVKYQGQTFMKLAERDLVRLSELQHLTSDTVCDLAEYYNEDPKTFSVDHCLESHRTLCINIRTCQNDIKNVPCQIEKCKKKSKDTKSGKLSIKDDDGYIIEKILKNIKEGMSLKRITKSCI